MNVVNELNKKTIFGHEYKKKQNELFHQKDEH